MSTREQGAMRVMAAISGVILVQTITGLIWAGAAAERLTQLELRVDRTADLLERTARLEEQTIHIRESLFRIEEKLDVKEGN